MSLKIEYISIEKLKRYEKNARTHSPEQIAQLVNSITEFGFTNPVLIDENNELIAGHGRTEAASELMMTEVPAIRLTGLTDSQKRALRIVDNQLALNAAWDLDLLAAEIVELEGEDFDIDLLGFDDDFLAGLLPSDEDPIPGDPDDMDHGEAEQKVQIVIGPYELQIPRSDWDKWETAVRAKVGFEKDDVISEIKRRLKI